MKLLALLGAMACACTPAALAAQSTGSSVQFPTAWAPGMSPCVQQANGTCLPVSASNPLPVTGGTGGGGGGSTPTGPAGTPNANVVTVQGISGGTVLPVAGPLTDAQLRASGVPVTGAFYQATQPVSATALPLPDGAATAAGLATINATLGAPYQQGGALPLPAGAATLAGQNATVAALPARDTNGDLRVPTVTMTPFFVSLAANTSTTVLAASASRVGYDVQCTGSAAIGISRTGATLTSATPSAGGADLVIPAGTTPYFQPAYVSGAGVTAYTGTAQSCWGNSYARQ